MPEVIAEMRRRGTGYAEPTIRTMIGAHLCADAIGVATAGYADFTRDGQRAVPAQVVGDCPLTSATA